MSKLMVGNSRLDVLGDDVRLMHYIDESHNYNKADLAMLDVTIFNNSNDPKTLKWVICELKDDDGSDRINYTSTILQPSESMKLNGVLIASRNDLHIHQFEGLSLVSVLFHGNPDTVIKMYNDRLSGNNGSHY